MENAAQLLSTHTSGVDWTRVRGTEDYHQWAVLNFFQAVAPTSEFEHMISSESCHLKDASEVLMAFWKTTTGTDLDPTELSRGQFPATEAGLRARHDGEWFWITHILTCLMNASTREEAKQLKKTVPWIRRLSKGEPTDTQFAAQADLGTWGTVTVVPGWVYFSKFKRLLERNCLLMIKDTCVARYCSKLSVWGSGNLEQRRELNALTDLYKAGDDVLVSAGNDGFRLIKLLEAHCNLRWTQIGAEKRPEIPLSPDFASHLATARTTLEEFIPAYLIRQFFDLVLTEDNPHTIGVFYGSFRHWGHPFIDYELGLEKLYKQVQLDKEIDADYVDKLASDLARKVLEREFKKQRKWFVDPDQMPPDHILKDYVKGNTWPPVSVLQHMGDTWHLLPLTACYVVPHSLDPATLLADKSHSPTLSELKSWIAGTKQGPFRTKKVLETALETEIEDLSEFCTRVDKEGLSKEHLVIGLKEKEREVNLYGRYFALMTWYLRLYFVVTEYLIKRDFLDLFPGITMKDSLNEVQKKLMESAQGQGAEGQWCFTNHIDYEKWNNHQRYASTAPIFTVMGKFYGLPRLFERTHLFFQESFIYYATRADTLHLTDEGIEYRGSVRTCWNGQQGGLEGLRQKGWTLCSMLVVEREGRSRNTKKLLRQAPTKPRELDRMRSA
jgi:hypothetical protein